VGFVGRWKTAPTSPLQRRGDGKVGGKKMSKIGQQMIAIKKKGEGRDLRRGGIGQGQQGGTWVWNRSQAEQKRRGKKKQKRLGTQWGF